MKYRYIYKITCTRGKFRNHFYYGQHTTENLNDGYKGSGKFLLDYYKKYPNDYVKEIIAFYDTEEALNQAEYDIIHPWLGNKMCLNICEGGRGGAKTPWNKGKKNCFSNEYVNNARERMIKFYENIEERQKQSERLKGRTPWNKDTKLNKIWMHKNNESPIYVCIRDVDEYLSLGYIIGRGKLNVKIHRTTCPIKGKKKTVIDGKIRYV